MVEFMQCKDCKSREHLQLHEYFEYFDAGLDCDTTSKAVVCNNCGCIHLPDGSFQIDAKPKEFSKEKQNYICEV